MKQTIYWAKPLASFATGLCAVIAARSAVVFADHNRRVYSILLLFALIWAMLLPYYSTQPGSDIILGFTGFLLWNVGRLVAEETTSSKNRFWQIINGAAPWLFLLMVSPSIIKILSLIGWITVPDDPWWLPTLAIAVLVSIVGYCSIWDALRGYSDNVIGQRVLRCTLLLYMIFEPIFVSWTYLLRAGAYKLTNGPYRCPHADNPFTSPYCRDMNEYFLIGFMILKLALTVSFVCLILKRDILQFDTRILNGWERVARFVFIRNLVSDDHIEKIKTEAKRSNEFEEAIHVLHIIDSPKARKAIEEINQSNDKRNAASTS